MSMQERERLAKHPNLFYSDLAAANDILRVPTNSGDAQAGMQTEAVALLLSVLDAGFFFQITMAQTGHHNDGPHGHWGGWAFDGAFLASAKMNDWLPAPSDEFDAALEKIGSSPYAYQTGLVGDSAPGDAYDSPVAFHYAEKGYIVRNCYAPGVSVFQDDGGAHVHMGAKPLAGW